MFIKTTKSIFLFLVILPVVIYNNSALAQEKPEIFVQFGHSAVIPSNAQQKRFLLGIAVGELDKDYANFLGLENNEGVTIKQVLKGSPSEVAGLRVGDVVIEINGRKIKNPAEFIFYVKNHNPDENMYLNIVRNKGEVLKIVVRPVESTKIPGVEITKPAVFDFDKNIIEVNSLSFESEVLNSERPVLAYFYAKWCTPCKNFVPAINDIVRKYGDTLKIVAIDVQKNETIAKEYGIGGLLPSIILFANGREFDKIIVPASFSHVEKLLTNFMRYKEEFVEIYPEIGKEQGITFVSFIDGSDFFVSKRVNKISLWDYKNGTLVKTFNAPVSSISFNGRFIALVSYGRVNVKIIDVLKDVSYELEVDQFIETVAVSGDGKYLATYGKEKNGGHTIKLWDVTSKKSFRQIPITSENVLIDFSIDGGMFVVSEYGYTRIFDTSKWKEVFVFKHPGESFREGRFSPDGRYLLTYGKKWHLLDLRSLVDNIIDISIIGFSKDTSKLFLARKGNIFELIDGVTKKTIITFQNYLAPIRFVTTSFDDSIVLSAGGDGVVRMWDIKSGKEIAQFIDYHDNEWIVVTYEGYYNSSLKGHHYLKVKKGKSVYGIDQFYDVFYRPDIVKAKLRGEDISGLITVTIEEATKNPPPTVEITSFPKDTEQLKAKVCYQIKSTGGGIGEVRLFHNGKLVYSDGFYRDLAKISSYKEVAFLSGKAIYEQMRGIKITTKEDVSPLQSKPKGEFFEDCKEIDVVSGENTVSVTAFNSQNTVQGYMKTITFVGKMPPQEPHLYILSIGIDKYRDSKINLKYAAKDAKDMVDKIINQAKTLYKPENIHLETIFNENATKSNVLNQIANISQKIKSTDSFILFIAGHGVLLENQYYMLTHDFAGNISEHSLISSNELIEISKRIKSLNQLFILDTCHAGGVDYIVSGLYDTRMSVLAKKMGLHVFASANSQQEALDGYKGNGLFTYSLLDGFNNNPKVDRNRDGMVSIVELGQYAKEKTVEISNSIGHSQIPLIVNFGRDTNIYKISR